MANIKGKVFLTGAGPGDPGLLTLRAAEILKSSDVVVYDRLVNPVILEMAPAAQKIYAGKSAGKNAEENFDQEAINALLIHHARSGKKVVRLKGGDPFVFGRGGEEAEALKKNKIPFEIIPGISAGHAVPAYAGIPVTDRRFASLVTYVTAHEDPEKEKAVDWEMLAKTGGTLVCFMSVRTLPRIAQSLMEGGKDCCTPVCVIQNGTLPYQKTVEGELWNIAQKTRDAKIESPALAVIGDVAALRGKLKWFEQKALAGKKVLVTRAQSQASALRRELEREGAEVLEFPAIQILPPRSWKPLDAAIASVQKFDWILFTSVNAVESFFARLKQLKKDTRVLASVKIAAIGEATKQALSERGLRADLMPKRFTSEELFKMLLAKKLVKGKSFLLPRTDIAPEILTKNLRKYGAQVTEVTAYRTVAAADAKSKKKLAGWLGRGIDYITFTSASSVQNFFRGLPVKNGFKSKLVSIGPVTSKTLREAGYAPHLEAREHTLAGMIEVMTHERK